VLNRGTGAIPIFKNRYNHQKFIQIFLYYQNENPPVRFSRLSFLSKDQREEIFSQFKKKKDFRVEIIAYCLMPNHFHFLLRQTKEGGIANFIRLSTNSYARWFNAKYQRKGSLFEGRFGAVIIENEFQLLHVSRYIHLNPYSSYLVKNLASLLDYPFSSLPEYLGKTKEEICQKEAILAEFSSAEKYKAFVLDQADYQRELEKIKHQNLEE
jgi:putative transposase